MKERPILFSAPMVRAILAGQKSQTRRIVKGTALEWLQPGMFAPEYVASPENHLCPHGAPGDRLWVREMFCETMMIGAVKNESLRGKVKSIEYAADMGIERRPLGGNFTPETSDFKWKPSIHMPRWASRIDLEITGVRVERLNEISEADCWSEGVEQAMYDFNDVSQCEMANRLGCCIEDAKPLFAQLWESIHGPGSFDGRWVWVIEFRRVAESRTA